MQDCSISNWGPAENSIENVAALVGAARCTKYLRTEIFQQECIRVPLSFDMDNALLHWFREQLPRVFLSLVFTRLTPVSEYQVSASKFKHMELKKQKIRSQCYVIV